MTRFAQKFRIFLIGLTVGLALWFALATFKADSQLSSAVESRNSNLSKVIGE